MDKQVVVFDISEGKKHSVCYKTSQDSPAVASIYIMRSVLKGSVPKKIKMTIEEAKE
jgi:hypothetical protein